MHSAIDIERSINRADADYPALFQLLAGYFHQDWREEYSSADDAVAAFRVEAPRAALREAVADIDRLLGLQLSDADLGRLLIEGFELNHVPAEGHHAWLEHVSRQLRAASRRDG